MKHHHKPDDSIKKFPLRFLSLCLFSIYITAGPAYGAVLSTEPLEQPASSESVSEDAMESAKIVSLEGDVKILRKNSESWQAAQKGQTVEAGDQILTGQNSSVDIAYDDYLLNISHIKENTKAEIRSINPTDIYLEDGSIFSALDGLSADSGYQIATPTAVAAVRGTHFDVGYDKVSQKFTAASLPTEETNHVSKIFVTDPQNSESGGVEVIENKQLDLKRGEPIRPNLVRPADPARLEAGKTVFAQMGQHMPQFQERRVQGKARIQELRQKGPRPESSLKNQDRNADRPFKQGNGPRENFNKENEPGQENFEKPAVDPLENVRALDAMLEEDKPQTVKPFGSYKPQRENSFGNRSDASRIDGENPNAGQSSPQGGMKPFGQLKPQSINSGFGRPNEMRSNQPGFQQPQGGPQKNAPAQEQRQGPPPQRPPKK